MDLPSNQGEVAKYGYVTSPMSRKDIRVVTNTVLDVWEHVTGRLRKDFDLILFMDSVMSHMNKKFRLITLPAELMGSYLGLSKPSMETIFIRDDVYTSALDGNHNALMIMAHELGHHIMHRDISHPKVLQMTVLTSSAQLKLKRICLRRNY
jgi:hypothetical protein